MAKSIDNTEDVIDSRDIIERVRELAIELLDAYAEYDEKFEEDYEIYKDNLAEAGVEAVLDFEDWLSLNQLEIMDFEDWLKSEEILESNVDQDDINEYKALKDLAEECEGYGDWDSGETLIRESYFTEYAEQLCKDIGAIPQDVPDYIEIDWDATAENLKVDYMEVDFAGVTYLMSA